MGNRLRRFVPRAPRYSFQPDDEKGFRFSSGGHRIQSSQIVNISTTGAAFVTLGANTPPIGAILKVEIPIPGGKGETIAWFGRVVRLVEQKRPRWIEKSLHQYIVVGIQFEALPAGHQKAIEIAISRKWREIVRKKTWAGAIGFFEFIKHNWLRLLIYAVAFAATVGFLYFLSQPSQTYDGKIGAPWGERFKF